MNLQRIMKSKYVYQEFKDEIKEEHERFDTYQETKDVSQGKCSHMGKVKIVNGELRCECGSAWSGAQINVLFDYFDKK